MLVLLTLPVFVRWKSSSRLVNARISDVPGRSSAPMCAASTTRRSAAGPSGGPNAALLGVATIAYLEFTLHNARILGLRESVTSPGVVMCSLARAREWIEANKPADPPIENDLKARRDFDLAWQKKMFEGIAHEKGQSKQASILVAQRLFPEVRFVSTLKATKIHDGMTDAALMAVYASKI